MPRRVLLLDNYDSFTWNLAHLIERCGAEVEVVRNDRAGAEELLDRDPSHVVVSPGPGSPAEAGISVELIRLALPRLPVLGVCLGHQALAVALGGEVRRAEPPVHGETSTVVHAGSGLFAGLPSRFSVARYHSLVVREDTLPSGLTVDARSDTGPPLIMAIRHRTRPAFGIQFHPESFLTECGRDLVSAFLRIAG